MRELRRYEWRRFGLKPNIDPALSSHIVRIIGAPPGYVRAPSSNTFAILDARSEREFQDRYGRVVMPDPSDPFPNPSLLRVPPRPLLDVLFQGKLRESQAARFKSDLEEMLRLYGVRETKGGYFYFSDWFTYGTLYGVVSAVARDRRVKLHKRQKPVQISNPVKRVKRVF